MSSILKALKKLENETADKETPQFVWPQPVDTKSSFNSRLQEGFSLKFFSYKMALLFFFSTTIILLIFISYPEKSQTQSGPVASVNPVAAPSLPAKKIIVEKTEEGVNAFVAIEPVQKVQEAVLESDMRQELTIRDEEVPKETVLEVDTQQSVAVEEASAGMPVKTTRAGWLTLQGISWSQEPLKRMAVINSVIAREGKVVDGGRVVRIDKKYVVIKKDGEELMLTFD